MARASYTYKIKTHAGKNCLLIEDQDNGMSVTNDIENVVDEILEKERIFPRDWVIIYKDTNGIWDGWHYNKEQFILLNCKTWEMAVELYIRIQSIS